jgi:hypothetical protein
VTESEVDAYLYFGYVPRVDGDDPFWIVKEWDRGEGRGRLESLGCEELVAAGIRALRAATDAREQHVVLLSGGFDSRAVLGALLDRLGPSQVVAATFGFPGLADFDLARSVAASAGLRHELVDARTTPCTAERLTQCVEQLEPRPYQPILQGPYLGHALRSRLGTGVTYWHGFLGDVLSGAHLPSAPAPSWDESMRHFAAINRGGGITRPGYDPLSILPRGPFVGSAAMTYPDQLDLAVRQPYCIYTRSRDGHRFARLFQHGAWVNFMLDVPERHRRDQSLYREILRVAYPRLFRVPTTHDRGVPLTSAGWTRSILAGTSRARHWVTRKLGARPPAVLRYMLRKHAAVVQESLADLERRRIVGWLDVQRTWRDHQAGARDSSRELDALVSLEANLKAEERAGGSLEAQSARPRPHAAS